MSQAANAHVLTTQDLARHAQGGELHAPAPASVVRCEKSYRAAVAGGNAKAIARAERALERAEREATAAQTRARRRSLAENAALRESQERERLEKQRAADQAEAVLREHAQPTMTLRYRGKLVTVTLASRDQAARMTAVEAARRLAHFAMLDFQGHVVSARSAAPSPRAFGPDERWVEKLLSNSSDLLPAARGALVSVVTDETAA